MKLLGSTLLVLAVLFAQVGTVAAAPQIQDGTTVTVSGNVLEIGQPVTDENGVITVLVKIETAEGTQTVRVSPDVAATLAVGTPAELVVNSEDVIPDEEPAEPDVHPISALLADFFFPDDPSMASMIDSFHNGDFQFGEGDESETQVFGFGVIAQALWMSQSLNDGIADSELASMILEAKATGNYEDFEFSDGSEPTNWGQFKQAFKDKENKNKHNLGVIVSGHADDDDNGQDQENGKSNKKNKGEPKGNNKGGNKP